MTVLLDTTVLINLLRGEASSIAAMRSLLREGHSLATSVINVGEIYSGARPHELEAADQLFKELGLHPVSFTIAKRAGEMRYTFARKGRTLELDDMLLAATALELGLPLLTDNVKDFKNTGVTFYGAGEN